MVVCKEMKTLRSFLTDKGIDWEDKSDQLICRTHFMFRGRKFSVVNGIGTYGGQMNGTGHNQGLLEVMIDDNEPIGWQTVKQVVKLMYGEDEE